MDRPDLHPRVVAALRPHQLISNAAARAAGLSAIDVQRLVRTGLWVAVRRGLYTPADHWADLSEHTGRPLLRARAAQARLGTDHVLSHDSAGLAHGLPMLRVPEPLVHVTRSGSPRAEVRHGVKRHHARFAADEVTEVDDLVVFDLARTALDVAREHGVRAGVVAIDAARQRGATLGELRVCLERMRRWPGVSSARAAYELSDPGAESVGETLLRLLLIEMGLGPIETQFEVWDGIRRARVDIRVNRQLFEFDGRQKYEREDRGGLARTDAGEVVWDEKRRQDWLCGYELGMSRATWADVLGPGREAAKRRLQREYDATTARFGTSIDDLAPIVVRRAA